MRDVKRIDLPDRAERNLQRWRKELLEELDKTPNGLWSELPPKFQNLCGGRWRNPAIRETLKRIYDGQCCYCECSLVKYARIEHYKPRKIFPKKALDWGNLHWCCEACNGEKGESFNKRYPFLDPSDDKDVITDHLSYEKDEGNRWLILKANKSADKKQKRRANITIDEIGLDNENRRSDRWAYYNLAKQVAEEYIAAPAYKRKVVKCDIQNFKCYFSVIAFAFEELGESI